MGKSRAQRYVVVVFDGVSLGIMSFAFGVFDMAAYYGVLPDLDIKVVSGENNAALTGGGLACPVPYDLDAIRTADLVIIPNWRDPAEPPPPPLLEALRAAHAGGPAGFVGDFSGVRRFAERDHKNIVQWTMHPEPGGHYAAHLEPDVLADDIRGFYASLASTA